MRKHIKRHVEKFWTVRHELAAAALALFFISASVFVLWTASLKLPDLGAFEARKVSQSTKLYDKTGKILLYDINLGIRRSIIPSGDISINVKNATVAIEDTDFYEHRGIKITSIIRAVIANLRSAEYSQGGSTITQQVIKNALLTTDKSIGRKLKEWILSLKLEREMTKDQILALYLNESPYGGNIYGVEEAAKTFFGKHASEVTLAEAAYLAAIPNAPTRYSPYGRNRSALEKRKVLVLERMVAMNFIGQKDYQSAMAEEVQFLPQQDVGIKAPHFVMYVRELLEKQYGSDVMAQNGYKVTTTLDYELEMKAEEIVKKYAEGNTKAYNASNAAITAVDPKTGGILVMAGSRYYFDKEIDGNFNIATAQRQPGSSFKPFVYAKAFEKGYTPDTIVFDLPTEFSTECNPDGTPINPADAEKCYFPENYDGLFKGPIKLKNALAESRNIPAIKVLYLTGLRDAIDLATDMGIKSLGQPDQYGLTLVLGGGEVSLLDMTGAYSVFANEGVKYEPHSIVKIEKESGDVIYEWKADPKRILSENIARMITDILSDNEARTPEFGANSPLYFPGYDVADKTGTTNDFRDAWILGYTPGIAVGAWAGNNDNSPMEKKIAGYIVAPMWHTFMEEAIQKLPVEHLRKPDLIDQTALKPVLRGVWQGGETYTIDKRTGQPGGPSTPEEFRDERVIPSVHEILHWVDRKDPLGPKPINPDNDSQYIRWEIPVQKWAVENNINTSPEIIPANQGTAPIVAPAIKKTLAVIITSPNQLGKYYPDNKIDIKLSITTSAPVIRVEFYVNGQYLDTSVREPFTYSFKPSDLPLPQKYNNIRVKVYNTNGEKAETVASFVVNY
ncbi:MAG: PBP1A family penicillin-binding protein [Candidatus Taylorbacteria bacterium]|nr:PBP1A family penicillin-binding protein [Candidatus Taylorbacteria bacterium]